MTPTAPSETEKEATVAPVARSGFAAGTFRPGIATLPSLPEAHRTVPFLSSASWFRKLLAFAGPGYLVAVGYMDPGNWATDIQGGSKFGYALLSVVVASSLMAMFLQALSAKLGIATGRDLAQACRDHYSRRTSMVLWVLCEIAIAACDLAEVLGSAVALKLLFGLPLLAGVLITALDVLIVLALQGRGFRLIEAFVVTLIATIAACFAYEIFFAQPLWREAAQGLIPRMEIFRNREMLYIADEVFFVGTAVEVTPIRSVDHIQVGKGVAGPITRKLQEEFFSITSGTKPDRHNWLTPVNAPVGAASR